MFDFDPTAPPPGSASVRYSPVQERGAGDSSAALGRDVEQTSERRHLPGGGVGKRHGRVHVGARDAPETLRQSGRRQPGRERAGEQTLRGRVLAPWHVSRANQEDEEERSHALGDDGAPEFEPAHLDVHGQLGWRRTQLALHVVQFVQQRQDVTVERLGGQRGNGHSDALLRQIAPTVNLNPLLSDTTEHRPRPRRDG